MGLVDKKKFPTVGKWASRFWLLGLIAGVVNSLRTIQSLRAYKLQEKDEKAEKVDASVDAKLFKAKRKLVWDFLDMFIALNSLDILHFTEGDVGLAGIVTSVMGLKDMWQATK